MAVLVGLRLQNIALIESLELTFEKGFTVLTGETGAGKSILLDALDALFAGASLSSGVRILRSGTQRAQIEARFLVNHLVRNWLDNHHLDFEEEDLFVSREWRLKDGRLSTRCRINGEIVNREQVISLRPLLIDLTIQGHSQQLALSGQQLRWLDHFGASLLSDIPLKVKSSWKIWHEAALELEELKTREKKYNEHLQQLEILLQDLEEAQLEDPYEDLKLKKEQDRLVNGVRLNEGISCLFTYLKDGSDQFPSVNDSLSLCLSELRLIENMDSSLKPCLDKLLDLCAFLQDLICELEQYHSLLEHNPEQLDELQARLETLKRLQRRNGLDLSQLIKRRDDLRTSLTPGCFDKKLLELEIIEKNAMQERDFHNKILSGMRKKIASDFEIRLMKHLSLIGLKNVQFKIEFNSVSPNEYGADTVQFFFSANPGQPLALLSQVASGGEMSRFLLALKVTLAEVDNSSTLLFDEIDSGVSGKVSAAIASLLQELSLHRQVFCVTHQPIVAAAANHHFSVSKVVEGGITTSHVSHLDKLKDRQKELAELAGGEFVEASSYAASLLDHHAA